MIEVPQEVQEILKSDSTHKEFIVHFPNGECPDITNENIVSESVKFEESICSQQQFKYGLAEASCLEFEFVDERTDEGVQTPALTDVFSAVVEGRNVKEMTGDVSVWMVDGSVLPSACHIYYFVYWNDSTYVFSGGITPSMTTQTVSLSEAKRNIEIVIGETYTGVINYTLGSSRLPSDTDGLVVITENGEVITKAVYPFFKYGNIKGMQIEAGVSYELSTPYVKRVQIPSLDQLQERIIGYSNTGDAVISAVNIAKDTTQGRVRLNIRLYEVNGDWYAERAWPYDVPSGTSSATLTIYGSVFASVASALVRDFIAVGKEPQTTLYYRLDTENYNGFLNATEISTDNVPTTLTHYEDEVYNSWTIPYGKFTVESCPRNHGNMAHRKVTAYSASVGTNENLPPFEKYKLKVSWTNNTTTYDIKDLARAWLHDLDGLTIAASQEGPSSLAPPSELSINESWDVNDPLCMGVQIGTVTVDTEETPLYVYSGYADITLDKGQHQAFGYKKVRDNITANELRPLLTTLLSRYDTYGYIYTLFPENIIMENLEYLAANINRGISYVETLSGLISYSRMYRGGEESEYMPLPSEYLTSGTYPRIMLRRATYIMIPAAGGTYPPTTRAYVPIDPVHDVYAFSDEPNIAPVQFKATLDIGASATAGYRYYYTNAFSYRDLLDGFLEMTAEYARPSRYGGLESIEMNDDNPYRISPSDYSECWWEEYEVEPIGTVKYKYSLNGDDIEATYKFGEGSSVYDMGSNAFIDALVSKSTSIINGLLDAYFIPKLQDIVFIPAELTMRALPFLEAGDCLQIEAEDGTIIKTYIMHQNIDGLQTLEADISSVDGSIIETDINAEVEEE